MMGLNGIANYLFYDNPISKSTISVTKSALNKLHSAQQPNVTIIQQAEVPPLWKLAAEQGPFVKFAGLMGASATILGAYGAHRTYPKENAEELRTIYQTANRYHFFHSLALLGVPLCKYPKLTGSLFVVGTFLFSGACYYHAFTGEHKFRRVAPIGGSLLILGWIVMVL